MEAAEKFELIKLLKNQLDEYIQKKADFLAEITTEPLATTKSAFFYRDVMMPFITNTLLTDNLARNEGIGYTNLLHNRLRIRVLINGKELKAHFSCSAAGSDGRYPVPVYIYPEELPYTLRCISASKMPPGIAEDKLCENPAHASAAESDRNLLQIVKLENGHEDVEIELPGPLGEYAFYAFLENLIRNAAKHNKDDFDEKPDRLLDIVIRVTTRGEKKDFFEVEVFDNVSSPDLVLDAPGGNKTLLDVIRELLTHRIIDEDFANLVRQAWGIAEMKICAMLLKGVIDFEELEKCLTAGTTKFENEKRLCYKLDLMKPKKICAVVPRLFSDKGMIGIDQMALERRGIWIFKDIAELASYVGDTVSIASFRFCLFDCRECDLVSKELEEMIHTLPFRIVISHEAGKEVPAEICRLIECKAAVITEEVAPYEGGASEITSWLWRVWLRRWLDKDQSAIVEVFLDQEKNLQPSSDWITAAETFNSGQVDTGPVKLRMWAKDAKGVARLAEGKPEWQGRRVFFDRHGGSLASLQTEEDFLGDHTYIFLDKLNSDFVRIFHPTFEKPWLFPYELAEAGMLRVLIADERMAERCLREVSDSNTLKVAERFTRDPFGPVPLTWHLAFGAKLYIVTHFGVNSDPKPLHKQSYEQADKLENRLLPFLKMKVDGSDESYRISYEWSPNRQEDVSEKLSVDALIIHQGILDQLNKLKSPDFLKNFLSEIRQSIPFVVVDSGRGIPPSLPSTAKFLPFSVLQDYVVGKRPAKYGLTQVMMALTRRKQED
ncbi:MAG TPA: hypothetical protein VJM50_07210 [Pyrinomonadaceae bacterium]|nr:hypothetical protein [Pyrinomonadaceae bacterium]